MEEQISDFEQTKLNYELVKTILSGISILVTIGVAYLGYRWAQRNWLAQKEKEQELEREKMQYQNKVDAAKAAWSLLAYLSEKENSKTIFVARGTKQDRIFFLREKQAEEFLEKLPSIFYDQGHGVFYSKEIRNKIFDFRSEVYRLTEWKKHNETINKNKEEGMIKIYNDKMIPKVRSIYEALNAELRAIIK